MNIKSQMQAQPVAQITQRTSSPPPVTQHAIIFSDNYFTDRNAVFEAGLPFLYVERDVGPGKVLRSPVSEYFPAGFRGAPIARNSEAEVVSNLGLSQSQQRVYLEAKAFEKPISVGGLGKLADLMPGTDIFLNTIIHWPKIITQNKKEGSIVNTAALFQSGYFLPKSPEYARFLLAEVFPKYAESSLEQVFAESLSLAVIDPDHFPIVQALLDLGADPNRESHDGISPLNESLLRTNIESVKLLLARGAQIRRDLSSEHPLDILRDEYDPVKHKELFKIFKNAM